MGHKPAYFIVKIHTGEPAQGELYEEGRRIPDIRFANKQCFALLMLLIVRSNLNSSIINE